MELISLFVCYCNAGREYDCQIEEADFRKLQTIGDLYNAVIKK